ncbi:pumilio homology domain family member 6, partial [Lecanoromycetidae sp. Uapishka_2]
MAGIKRKINSDLKPHATHIVKKSKKEHESPKSSKAIQELEAETDSDPIIESDTTSQSGDDDGASWPSDEDNKGLNKWDGVSSEEKEDDGGAKIAAEAASAAPPSASANDANLTKSREAHAKQKIEKQERKAARPNADSIARSKKLWERLRRKSHVPLEERKALVTELFDIITGRVKDFVFKHDSVRVVQTALKYANIDQRKMVARELKGDYKTLAESKYAKFLIGKMLVHGDEETRDLVVPEFYGHVRRLMKHPEASWIVDDIYRGIATPSQKATILREWYGAEYALFKANGKGPVSADLQQILAEHPEKRTPIMRSLLDLINLLVQKKTTGFTMLHDAMLQYFLNVQSGGEEMTEFIELLKGDEEGDLLKNLAFTKSGARLVCLALARGNAKDRKQILKTYKDTKQALAYDVHGHKVLLAVYDVVDDTVHVSKVVFPELVGKDLKSESQWEQLLSAAIHLNGRIALLYPFCGKAKAILSNEDLKLLDEIHRIRTATSKKDPEIRRRELVASLAPPLLSLITSHAKDLVSTSFGCQFITEVLLGSLSQEGRKPALKAIVALANRSEENQELLKQPAAGRMLKTLVLGGRFNPGSKVIEVVNPPLGFHEVLYERIKDDVISWAVGCNSFVVVGLLEAEGFSKAEELRKILSKPENIQTLRQVAGKARDGDTAGADGVDVKKKKKGKDAEELPRPDGNRGTRLLLDKFDSKK